MTATPVLDYFTRANSSSVVGSPWVTVNGVAGISTGRMCFVTPVTVHGGNSECGVLADTGVSDFDVRWDFILTSGVGQADFYIASDATNDNAVDVILDCTGGNVYIYELIADSFAVSTSATFSGGIGTYNCRVTKAGRLVTFYVNGTQVVQRTLSQDFNGTWMGPRASSYGGNDITKLFVDNVNALDPSAGFTYLAPNPGQPSNGRSILTNALISDYPITTATATKAIAGSVTDSSGDPVVGAAVKLFRSKDDFCCQRMVSDGSGNYSFPRDTNDPNTYYVVVYDVVDGASPPPIVDASSGIGFGFLTDSSDTGTWSHTVGSGATMIAVGLASNAGSTCAGVTYAGEAMTLVASVKVDRRAEVWVLYDPPAGTANVVISPYSGGGYYSGASVSIAKSDVIGTADTATNTGGYGGSNLVASTFTTPATSLILGFAAVDAGGASSVSGGAGVTVNKKEDNTSLGSVTCAAVSMIGGSGVTLEVDFSGSGAASLVSFEVPFLSSLGGSDTHGTSDQGLIPA